MARTALATQPPAAGALWKLSIRNSGSGARSSVPAVGVGAMLMNTGKRMQSPALIFKMSSIYPEGSSVRSSPRSRLRGLFQGSPAHAPRTRCCPSRCPNAPAAGTRGWQSEHPANPTKTQGKPFTVPLCWGFGRQQPPVRSQPSSPLSGSSMPPRRSSNSPPQLSSRAAAMCWR